MRFYEKTKITISEDTTNEPKLIRLSEDIETTDVTLLKESISRQETFPVGTHAISLGNIALGKFLYLKPKQDMEFSINGSTPVLKARGGKATKMWVEITSLSITISTDPQEVLVFCAGE
jgi:hypothetical protein